MDNSVLFTLSAKGGRMELIMGKSVFKIKSTDILLYLYLLFVMLYYTTNNSYMGTDIRDFIILFAMVIGIVKVFMALKVDLKTLAVLCIFGVIVIQNFLHNKDSRILVAFLSILCALNEDRSKIINGMLYSKLFTFVAVVLLGGGYRHINQFALQAGMILLLYFCKREKHGYDWYIKLFMCFLSTIIICLYTDSGSAKVCLALCIVLYALKKTKTGIKILKTKIIMLLFPIALFFNYFFAIGVGEGEIPFVGQYFSEGINRFYINLVRILDVATSRRLTLVKSSFIRFGGSWLGGNVDYSTLNLQHGQYFLLDSGFIWLIQGWGYLMCILMMVLLVILMRYFNEIEEYNYIIAGIGIALWAINEDMLVSVGTNFLLFFIGQAIWYYVHKGKSERKVSRHKVIS